MSILLFLYRVIKSTATKKHARKQIAECNCDRWQELIDNAVCYEFFITNSIGGGTEFFTKNYLDSTKHVLILRNISYGKDWFFVVENKEMKKSCAITLYDVVDILKTQSVKKVTVNTLVTNLHTFEFLKMLQKSAVPVTVMVHDYYLVCPNYTLFKNGAHCGFAFCNKNICTKGCNPFLTPRCSLKEWREKWNAFLLSVKEIRCFSQSSRNIVRQAYPDIDREKITVVPHSMEYCHFTPVSYQKEPVHIGIVGAITSTPKGSNVVRSFLRYAKKKNVMVSVIGTYPRHFRLKGKTIRYTGTYNASELQQTIEKEKVNCLLFPSLWSETFSYLVSEQIMMRLPIVCFDYGAQAEKIRAYQKGVVCRSTKPEAIYEALKTAVRLQDEED